MDGNWKVNLMTMVYNIGFFPGTVLSSYLLTRWGLSVSVNVGVFLNFLSGWLRFAGSSEKFFAIKKNNSTFFLKHSKAFTRVLSSSFG